MRDRPFATRDPIYTEEDEPVARDEYEPRMSGRRLRFERERYLSRDVPEREGYRPSQWAGGPRRYDWRVPTPFGSRQRPEWREEPEDVFDQVRDFFGVGPRGFRRSDERIYEDVCERLMEDPLLDASDIDVSVRNGDVTVRGTVASRDAKRRAEDIVESALGVSDLRNEIHITRGGAFGMLGRREAGALPTGRAERFTAPGMRTIACIIDTFDAAQRCVDDLRMLGVGRDQISLVTRERGELRGEGPTKGAAGAGTGAVLGGVAGGALGWLLGIGALTIPGIGPLLALGPIAAAIGGAAVGATAGGLVGALVAAGIPETEARRYEERIREGGVLITIQGVPEAEADRVRDMCQRHEARDLRVYRADETPAAIREAARTGDGEPAVSRERRI
ncbi:MAG: BON domain-containing protein [Elusimicrobia bacterium]|nr:BON domain-containing protein [Elusimicrobiota bacterium]